MPTAITKIALNQLMKKRASQQVIIIALNDEWPAYKRNSTVYIWLLNVALMVTAEEFSAKVELRSN